MPSIPASVVAIPIATVAVMMPMIPVMIISTAVAEMAPVVVVPVALADHVNVTIVIVRLRNAAPAVAVRAADRNYQQQGRHRQSKFGLHRVTLSIPLWT